jgi:hypothetical protein
LNSSPSDQVPGTLSIVAQILTKAIASSYYSHSRFLEIVEFHMDTYGEAMAKSRSPEPM